MTATAPNTDTHPDTFSVRLRLTPPQVKKLERVRSFLGLPSLSSTAARLALWNADALAVSLGMLPDEKVNPRAVLRAAIVEGGK